jgi:hypothetical protein
MFSRIRHHSASAQTWSADEIIMDLNWRIIGFVLICLPVERLSVPGLHSLYGDNDSASFTQSQFLSKEFIERTGTAACSSIYYQPACHV